MMSEGYVAKRSIIQRESSGKKLIDQTRIRLYCVTVFFTLFFMAIATRLVEVAIIHHNDDAAQQGTIPTGRTDDQSLEELTAPPKLDRNDIVDRNGLVLATTLYTESLFANPQDLINANDAAHKLAHAFPEINERELAKKLSRDSTFVWIKRNLTPKEQRVANDLGIPGLYFQPEQKRVYPYSAMLSHVIGYVGVDHKGLAGVERYFDEQLRDTKDQKEPLQLSIDLRFQNIVYEEIKHAMEAFNAIGATGVVLDLKTGEVLALANLPDFDPHQPGTGPETNRFDRAAQGTYEMGSTFKTFTTAMALDYGVVNLNDGYDASHPLEYSQFVIKDDHPQNRWLTIPEIYTYSSNIGTARMAMDVGTERQKAFLRKLGLMEPIKIELPEIGSPHYPEDWKEINTITISYGHGMSVTPLQLVRAFTAIVDGGTLETLTLLKGGNDGKQDNWPKVINEKTSREMRRLMRMVVQYGTGKHADVPGYRVGGKTGTAEKVAGGGGYSHHANLALFISTFPIDNPQYVVLVMVDEPKGEKETHGFATAGWNAAPAVGNIISRIAPMAGIRPLYDVPEDSVNQYWINNANQKFMHAVSY